MSTAPDTSTNGTPKLPRLGDIAPDFTAVTTQGEITFSNWQGDSWVVLFSHPADFTPICSTELSEFARRVDEFTKRNTKLIGISIDSIHAHLAWTQNLQHILQVKLTYPLIADLNTAVAQKYGMIHPGASETVTVRALFVIDPTRKVRAVIYYPLNVGRNVDEVVRLLDALQTADKKGVALPVNWKPGDKVIVPAPKTEKDVEERLAGPYERLDFYLCKKELV
jgi:peroxiredoxin (alkyl hydroperoxide reductase subunit C)